jgi:phage-related tail protein
MDDRAIEALTGYAKELEKQAADMEATVGRTAQLAGGIAREIAKAQETIGKIAGTLNC